MPQTDDVEPIWLTEETPAEVESLMRARGWLDADEAVARVEMAGEGNMNVTLRVVTTTRSVILKQARPWVAKYPSIAAPVERAQVEHAWYRAVADLPGAAAVGGRMPRLLGADDATYTLLIEDLGAAADLSTVYATGELPEATVDELAGFLRELHDATAGKVGEGFANLEMRRLNHAHIFEVPMQADNGIDLEALEPGLSVVVAELRADAGYREQLEATGRAYLRDYGTDVAGAGDVVLLHGDFFPGSWLVTDTGVRVIDPEFGFAGPRAFDVTIAAAHLMLADRTDLADRFFESYGPDAVRDAAPLVRFMAAEVMRRLIGVAQLPLPDKPVGWRAGMLVKSAALMKAPDLGELA